MRTSISEAAEMVEWNDLDVYDKLLRIIDTGTHHIKFHDKINIGIKLL
jgi:hypothetical protein